MGYEQRQKEIQENDIHLKDDYSSSSPSQVRQMQLKSNLHTKQFYQENPSKTKEDKVVYEFEVGALPSGLDEGKELAKIFKG